MGFLVRHAAWEGSSPACRRVPETWKSTPSTSIAPEKILATSLCSWRYESRCSCSFRVPALRILLLDADVALVAETNWEDGHLYGSFCTVPSEHSGHHFLHPVYLVSCFFRKFVEKLRRKFFFLCC